MGAAPVGHAPEARTKFIQSSLWATHVERPDCRGRTRFHPPTLLSSQAPTPTRGVPRRARWRKRLRWRSTENFGSCNLGELPVQVSLLLLLSTHMRARLVYLGCVPASVLSPVGVVASRVCCASRCGLALAVRGFGVHSHRKRLWPERVLAESGSLQVVHRKLDISLLAWSSAGVECGGLEFCGAICSLGILRSAPPCPSGSLSHRYHPRGCRN